MRIIFSLNRAAQLDLLLESLNRNAPPEDSIVIWRATDPRYRNAYLGLIEERGLQQTDWLEQRADFAYCVLDALKWPDAFVTFFCDDDVVFGSVGDYAIPGERELCFSLRLGTNTDHCYPSGQAQRVPTGPWRWQDADGDFAYPGSLDGHVFRRADVLTMLEGKTYRNPTELEDVLQAACGDLASEYPLMRCYQRSVLVSVPANRVSEQSQVRSSMRLGESAGDLNESFLAGGRLSLGGMDFSGVDAAHCELPLVWAE